MTATEVLRRRDEWAKAAGQALSEKVDSMVIEGMDANYNYQTETIAGHTGASSKTWSRVFRVCAAEPKEVEPLQAIFEVSLND